MFQNPTTKQRGEEEQYLTWSTRLPSTDDGELIEDSGLKERKSGRKRGDHPEKRETEGSRRTAKSLKKNKT